MPFSRRAALLGGGLLLSAAAKAATTLRWATVVAPTHPEAAMMRAVAADVFEGTGGAVAIEVYAGGALGSSHDIIAATWAGAVQMVVEGAAQFGRFVAPFSILESPYLWRDLAHMRGALAGPLMHGMQRQMRRNYTMRMLGWNFYGTRHLTTTHRAVRTMADMAGLRLRVPAVAMFRAMATAWGAEPAALDIAELAAALRAGAVDAQENPLPTIATSHLDALQRCLVLTAHVMTPRPIMINEAAWQRLAAPERRRLAEAIARRSAEQNAQVVALEQTLPARFAATGMTVITPDVESFRRPVLAVMPALFGRCRSFGLWKAIRAA